MRKIPKTFLISAAFFLWLGGASADGPVQTMKTDGIEYMTGGFGFDERREMGEMAKGFNLKTIFAGVSGDYLADVTVTIAKASGEKVMDIPGAGPWLFVKLPPGKYSIKAVYEGTARMRTTDVGRGLKSIMFRWKD